eukprot:g24660.t1
MTRDALSVSAHTQITSEDNPRQELMNLLSLFRPSAIPSERRNRSTTALGNSLEILLGNVLAMIISWVTLWVFAPDSLAQVGRIFPVLSVTLLMVILCVLPVLILFGLGSSRVWRQAMLAFMGAITGPGVLAGTAASGAPPAASQSCGSQRSRWQVREVSRSIKVLGWPFTRIASYWRAHQVTASRKSNSELQHFGAPTLTETARPNRPHPLKHRKTPSQ